MSLTNSYENYAKTLTESTFNFSIENEEIRAGAANSLWGKYFHDSNLEVTLTDAMFNLEYVAASLGADIKMGGLVVYESPAAGETVAAGGTVTLKNTPLPFEGSLIGWYKKPTDSNWSIATITGTTMTIPGAQVGDNYCIKYMYQNPNSKSMTIKTQYVPAELHVIIINDLFAGDNFSGNSSETTKIGHLITDIPRLQMNGNQELNLTSTSAATVSLTGSALSVSSEDSCEEEPYYGTMTEEIIGADWRNEVIALAVENGDVDLDASGTETLIVRAVFGGPIASQRKDNSNFLFAVETSPAVTATGTAVSAEGVITAGKQAGTAVVSVTLVGDNKAPVAGVEPAYVLVTVA